MTTLVSMCRACPSAALCVLSSAGLRHSARCYVWPCWYLCVKCHAVTWLRIDVPLEIDEWGIDHKLVMSRLPKGVPIPSPLGRINHCLSCWQPKVIKTHQPIFSIGQAQPNIAGPTHIDPGDFLLVPGPCPIPNMHITVMTDVAKKHVAIVSMDINNTVTSELIRELAL